MRLVNKKGVGDNHIKQIINSIQVTDSDLLVRYAGDEFVLFSNTNNLIETNKLFSVGIAQKTSTMLGAINEADKNMIDSKSKFKQESV